MNEPPFEIRTAVFRVPDCSFFLPILRQIGADHGTRIVCFNADMMAGRAHVEAALARALRAERTGTAISSSFEMEALLSAAGDRQCTAAARFGIHEGTNRAYVCLSPPSEEAFRALSAIMEFVEEDWEDLPPDKVERLGKAFGITPQEVAVSGSSRFRDLILERVALLEVYR